jgi:hypothetical protein
MPLLLREKMMSKEQKTLVPFVDATSVPERHNVPSPSSNPRDARKVALAELAARAGKTTGERREQLAPFVDPLQGSTLALRNPVRRAQFAESKEEARRATLAMLAAPRPRAHLALVIDATGSRSVMWHEAKKIQRRMVEETRQFGRMSLRVVHFGGGSVNAYPATWTDDANRIAKYMDGIQCRAGGTQIVAAIEQALASNPGPTAIVAIGDTCEEHRDVVRKSAAELGRRSIPVFSFFDTLGRPDVEFTLPPTGTRAEGHWILAEESGGVFARFGDKLDLSSLMMATAAYVAGGAEALLMLAQRRDKDGQAALQLVDRLRLPPPSRK